MTMDLVHRLRMNMVGTNSLVRVVRSLTFRRVDRYGGNDGGVILGDLLYRPSARSASLLSFQTLTRNTRRVARQP